MNFLRESLYTQGTNIAKAENNFFLYKTVVVVVVVVAVLEQAKKSSVLYSSVTDKIPG
jgi:hypothetical protein